MGPTKVQTYGLLLDCHLALCAAWLNVVFKELRKAFAVLDFALQNKSADSCAAVYPFYSGAYCVLCSVVATVGAPLETANLEDRFLQILQCAPDRWIPA